MGRFILGLVLVAISAALIEFYHSFATHPSDDVVEPSVETVTPEPVVPTIPTQSPYTLTAVLDETGRVVLDGYVPSEESLEDILERAEADFGANVVNDTLRIAMGDPANWTDAALISLDELDHLQTGRLSMRNEEITLTGTAADTDERAEINALAAQLPDNFNALFNIEVLGAADEAIGQTDDEAVCQDYLATLNERNELQFATGSAQLRDERAEIVLGRLATGMNQCPGLAVMVEGHASKLGDDDMNMQLSKDRAAAVVTYLADLGVDMERLTSEGYGETRPKVTPTGPDSNIEANRRIEFIVSR